MRSAFLAGSALCLACTLAHAETVVFDYSDTGNSSVMPPYSETVGGVTFHVTGGSAVYIAPGQLGNVDDGASGPLTLSFSTPLSSLSFDFSTYIGGSTLTADLFENGTLVGTDSVYTCCSYDSLPVSNSVDLTGMFNSVVVNTDEGLGIGSLTAVTATPEPASLALLGTGALGAFGVLRRRVAGGL